MSRKKKGVIPIGEMVVEPCTPLTVSIDKSSFGRAPTLRIEDDQGRLWFTRNATRASKYSVGGIEGGFLLALPAGRYEASVSRPAPSGKRKFAFTMPRDEPLRIE